MSKKLSYFKIFLIIFFLLIIGSVFYFLLANKTPATKSSVSTSTATSSLTWDTYINTVLGFQIDFSSGLAITDYKDRVSFNEDDRGENGGIGMWEIGVSVTTPGQTLDEILKQYNTDNIFEKKFTIDGFDAYEYGLPQEKGETIYEYGVLVMNGKKLYDISLNGSQDNDQITQYNNQIISSFHFLK